MVEVEELVEEDEEEEVVVVGVSDVELELVDVVLVVLGEEELEVVGGVETGGGINDDVEELGCGIDDGGKTGVNVDEVDGGGGGEKIGVDDEEELEVVELEVGGVKLGTGGGVIVVVGDVDVDEDDDVVVVDDDEEEEEEEEVVVVVVDEDDELEVVGEVVVEEEVDSDSKALETDSVVSPGANELLDPA